MRFIVILSAILTIVSGRRVHDQIRQELEEATVPVLSEKQSEAINKFEDHKIFARVWKEAGQKLAEEMQELREKKDSSLRQHHKHHHKHIIEE